MTEGVLPSEQREICSVPIAKCQHGQKYPAVRRLADRGLYFGLSQKGLSNRFPLKRERLGRIEFCMINQKREQPQCFRIK